MLLLVGTIVGTLDDVMYGVATFDEPAMLLKTADTFDELADGEILHEIHGPTPEDPYRFPGFKWDAKGSSPAVSKLVRPRGLVFLEATDIREGCHGQRIGCHLMHSLDLSGTPSSRVKPRRSCARTCRLEDVLYVWQGLARVPAEAVVLRVQ